MDSKQLEVALQDMQFDSCTNMMDPTTLKYAEEAQDLRRWVHCQSPPYSCMHGVEHLEW